MLLKELPPYLDGTFSYPVDLETVVEVAGSISIESPNPSQQQDIESILEPLGEDQFDSPYELYAAIYGSLADPYIGRKFYDDRGTNHLEAGPRESIVSF